MKKIIILIAILSMIVLFERDDTIAKSLETEAGGQKIYQSVKAKNPADLEIAGINLSKYKYSKIYQYSLIGEKALFVIGGTKTGVCELSVISLSNRKKNIISKYPSGLSQLLPKFSIFIMNKLKASTFAVIEFNKLNRKRIEVYHADVGYNFQLLKKEDVSFQSKIFISDADADGFTDILIWGKTESKGKNITNFGEMSVMLFNSQGMNFSSLKLLRSIKMESSGR